MCKVLIRIGSVYSYIHMLCESTILVIFEVRARPLFGVFNFCNKAISLLFFFFNFRNLTYILKIEICCIKNTCLNFFQPCVVGNITSIKLIQGNNFKLIFGDSDYFQIIFKKSAHESKIIQVIEFKIYGPLNLLI